MKASRCLALLIVGAALFGCAGRAVPGDTLYTRPGRLVDAGGHRLNLYCMGTGAPAVIFDSGWEDWAPAWVLVQPAVSKWTQTCTYDRAGSGFSDPGPMPRTSVRIAAELHRALRRAGIAGPYILVGHSFGSYNTRAFADRYMGDVAGLVLVDGEDGDVESPAARQRDAAEFASLVDELRQCRSAVAQHRTLPLLPPATSRISCDRQFFRGLPERMFSPALNAAILHIAATKPALYDAVISEMQQMPWDEVYLQDHRRSFGARPIRVLTAQNHFYDTAKTAPALHAKHLAFERNEARVQARWLALSSDSKQTFALKSGHYIQFDQPYIVIDAIRDVLLSARGKS